jgi:hypothetical protein
MILPPSRNSGVYIAIQLGVAGSYLHEVKIGNLPRRLLSSGMLHHVALVRTDVSEERITIIRLTGIGELGTTLAVTNDRSRANRYSTP